MSTSSPSTIADDTTSPRYPTLAALQSAHNDLLRRQRQDGDTRAFREAAVAFLHAATGTGMLLDADADRRAAQSLLDYWAARLFRLGEEPPDTTLADFDPRLAPELPDELCPYLGLDAFREQDAEKYFGRVRLIGEVLDRLAERRLLAVVGPSGSGKSSLVRAGLIPSLRAGALPGSERWQYLAPMVPGPDPLGSLDHALSEKEMGGQRDEETRPPVSSSPCLLVVDQFEELFTLCDDEAARRAFIARLVELVEATEPRHHVILTMRSDFEPFIARAPELQALFEDGRVQVTPLSAIELRETIERPAEAVGLKFEAGVVDLLLQDILGEPAGLPLLQFTLLKLWEHRQRNRVTRAIYDHVGGGRLALARCADELYADLIPEEQVTARRILLRLVRPGEGLEITSSRVRRADLHRGGEDPGRIDRVLAKLITAHLLRLTKGETTADAQVEVAHEALVRNWPTLVEWIEEEKVALATRRRLGGRAAEWVRLGQGAGGLLDLVELREAEQWLKGPEAMYLGFDPVLPALVAASRRAVDRRARRIARLRLALVIVSLGAALLGLGLAVFAFQQRLVALGNEQIAVQNADVARRNADVAATAQALAQQDARIARSAEAQTLSLARAGEALFELDHRPDQALLLALSAIPSNTTTYQPTVSRAFYRAYEGALIRRTLVGHKSTVTSVKWSPDGRLLLTGSYDGTARVWDSQSGKTVRMLQGPKSPISAVAWSPDGRYAVTASSDAQAHIWDISNGAEVRSLRGHTQPVDAVAWSLDGRHIVTGSFDATVRVWDADSAETILDFRGHDGPVRAVALSPDGRRILTGGDDTTARVWDATTGKLLLTLAGHARLVTSVAWSPDAHQILTGSGDGTARVWDGDTGTPIRTLVGGGDWTWSVAWSPNGKQVLTGEFGGTARIWDATTGAMLNILQGHTAQIWSVDWRPRDGLVATGSQDQTARIWDSVTGVTAHMLHNYISSQDPIFWSFDLRLVATGDKEGNAHIWDVATGEEIRALVGHRAAISAVSWRLDSQALATSDESGMIIIWDVASGRQLRTLQGSAKLTALSWSYDGRYLAAGSDGNGSVQVWDTNTGAQSLTVSRSSAQVSTIGFSPDGQILFVGYLDGTGILWRTSTGAEEHILRGHTARIWSSWWSPDSQYIITGSGDRTARIWSRTTGETIRRLEAHTGAVLPVLWSPDGRRVMTGSSDGTARIWDFATGAEIRTLEVKAFSVSFALWSLDGRQILTGTNNGTARIWLVRDDLIKADVTRRVCDLFTDEVIRSKIATWRGCAIERAEVQDALAVYDQLYMNN